MFVRRHSGCLSKFGMSETKTEVVQKKGSDGLVSQAIYQPTQTPGQVHKAQKQNIINTFQCGSVHFVTEGCYNRGDEGGRQNEKQLNHVQHKCVVGLGG